LILLLNFSTASCKRVTIGSSDGPGRIGPIPLGYECAAWGGFKASTTEDREPSTLEVAGAYGWYVVTGSILTLGGAVWFLAGAVKRDMHATAGP